MTAMSSSAIRTDDLTRDFGPVRALDGVTLDVPAGIVFGLLGPNGSGKTTLIRLLLGLIEPDRGRATVLGHDPRSAGQAVRERCGVLLEHCGLYERLTAEQNLDMFARFWRLEPGARRGRIHEVLAQLELWDRRADIVGTWSRGMKQKLAIARAMLHRPTLVFLDEPTAGLDALAARTLREDLARLASSGGATVFLTTHNLAESERLCAKVAVIRRGQIVADGSPAALRGARASLEDAFLDLMETSS
jgi:ABC-2 type transport system ATP-binding protein